MDASRQDLYRRWDEFVRKAVQRHTDVLAETEQGCKDAIAQNPGDPSVVTNALGAINARVIGIRQKVSEAYVQQMFTGLDGPAYEQAHAQLKATLRWMEQAWESFRARMEADAARAMWPLVSAAMARPVACVRCGGALEPASRRNAQTITCPFCAVVNEVVPEPVVYTFYAMAPHAYAHEQSLPRRFAIDKYREEVDAWRTGEFARGGDRPDEPVESLRRWEAMERDYQTAYFAAKAQIAPSPPEEQAKDVASRMRPFYEALERNPVWVAARRAGS